MLFVASTPEDFAGAVEESTAGDYSHVGIYAGHGNIWESTPSCGVCLTPLRSFLEDAVRVDVYRISSVRRDGLPSCDIDAALSRAADLRGRPYDFAFAPGDNELYCSELVQECFGSGLFPCVPMNFAGPDGLPLPYWVAHFDALGLPVPQGAPGTNPNDLSRSLHLQFIRSLP